MNAKTNTPAATRDWPRHPFTGRPTGWLNAAEVAQLIPCREDQIPVLVERKLLVPLGSRMSRNSRLMFAVTTMQANLADPAWLSSCVTANSDRDQKRNLRKKHLVGQKRSRSKANPFGDAPDASPMPTQSSHAE